MENMESMENELLLYIFFPVKLIVAHMSVSSRKSRVEKKNVLFNIKGMGEFVVLFNENTEKKGICQ